ncbi:Na+/H+-dicarboxylate symporter [Bacteroides zoogleoformans]|uniref:Sodium:proton antiporter n=1 Tax=Bacteroides zoogleoformans TaxID=28119 RepID=A0ABM6T5H1_9BACE|nr:dicarboxylate/amino acid:cation symporter [Bacteroides zoogleoformans]AVM51860.1 sodium:proton antiporter [Bacteroides zoogleoformans]TWJ16952.1 Na+/H+-dicarboxylate symporter [Bacteroides zoogleoformans]
MKSHHKFLLNKKFRIQRFPLLLRVVVAIILGLILGRLLPEPVGRVFITFNSLFGEFLSFSIPLIILGLVAPAIAHLGRGAGKLLVLTAAIAYISTVFSGYFTYLPCMELFPDIISREAMPDGISKETAMGLLPYFQVQMPPALQVMTALVLAFTLGLGMALLKTRYLQNVFDDFRNIISIVIEKVIIPLLPFYIFGIFLNMVRNGEAFAVLAQFSKVIVVIFTLHILLLLIQFTIAGVIGRKNPLKLLRTMLPAYATALGTSSSAATIPVTLKQTIKNGVQENIAGFTVPLCATIHMAGSTMKITACALAIMYMNNMSIEFGTISRFIFMLGITMVAAPGVPGGSIMAALGLLSSILGFNEQLQALMIALYIAMDSFGTACNVTGDGAISVIVDKIAGKEGRCCQNRE